MGKDWRCQFRRKRDINLLLPSVCFRYLDEALRQGLLYLQKNCAREKGRSYLKERKKWIFLCARGGNTKYFCIASFCFLEWADFPDFNICSKNILYFIAVCYTNVRLSFSVLSRCTVDPYLFQNFATYDGDRVTAKFKAFKFPESPLVLFKGTVSVCLDRCRGVSQHIYFYIFLWELLCIRDRNDLHLRGLWGNRSAYLITTERLKT